MDNKQNNSININNMSLDLEKYNLRNSNGFQLNDNEKIINDEFKFQRKIINQYNPIKPIKDKMETIKSPPYKNEKKENKNININIKHFKGKETQLINPPQTSKY